MIAENIAGWWERVDRFARTYSHGGGWRVIVFVEERHIMGGVGCISAGRTS